jgi:hypothetical protein
MLTLTLTIVTAAYAFVVGNALLQQQEDSEQRRIEWETSTRPLVILNPTSDEMLVETLDGKIAFQIDLELNNYGKDLATHVLYYAVPVHYYDITKTEGCGRGIEMRCNVRPGERTHVHSELRLDRRANDLGYHGSDKIEIHFVCISRSLSGKWYKYEIVNHIDFRDIVEGEGTEQRLSGGKKRLHETLPLFYEIEEVDILKEEYMSDESGQYRPRHPMVSDFFKQLEGRIQK